MVAPEGFEPCLLVMGQVSYHCSTSAIYKGGIFFRSEPPRPHMKGNENRIGGWCLRADLNHRQAGYEPDPLPTEVRRHIKMLGSCPCKHSISAKAHIEYLQQFIPKKPLPNKAILSSPLPRPIFPLRGIGNIPFGHPTGARTPISTLKGWPPNQLEDGTIIILLHRNNEDHRIGHCN